MIAKLALVFAIVALAASYLGGLAYAIPPAAVAALLAIMAIRTAARLAMLALLLVAAAVIVPLLLTKNSA